MALSFTSISFRLVAKRIFTTPHVMRRVVVIIAFVVSSFGIVLVIVYIALHSVLLVFHIFVHPSFCSVVWVYTEQCAAVWEFPRVGHLAEFFTKGKRSSDQTQYTPLTSEFITTCAIFK
jgi:hypothetical protein